MPMRYSRDVNSRMWSASSSVGLSLGIALVLTNLAASVALAQAVTVPNPKIKDPINPPAEATGTDLWQINVSDGVVRSYSARLVKCEANLSDGTVAIKAVLKPARAAIAAGKTRFALKVDDRTVYESNRVLGAQEDLQVNQTISLTAGAAKPHQVQFYLNNVKFGPEYSLRYNCVTPKTQAAPSEGGRVEWPDLAIEPMLIFQYGSHVYRSRDNPRRDPCAGIILGCHIYLPDQRKGLRDSDLIIDDTSRVIPLQRIIGRNCPRGADAYVIMRIWVGFRSKGIDGAVISGEGIYYQVNHQWFVTSDPYYLDTRFGTQTASEGLRSVPVGYEWLIFDRMLPCTQRGNLDITLDPDNVVRESDETNNSLHLFYRTMKD